MSSEKSMKTANPKIRICACVILVTIVAFVPRSAYAYHPLSTDDPGTVPFRHFELEWGNDFVWPGRTMDESSGYVAIKSGIAPGLEFDAGLGFHYFVEGEEDHGVSDPLLLLKYRFLGDGNGPNNLGAEVFTYYPTAEAKAGLMEVDETITTALLFGSFGGGDVRAFWNAGAIFVPHANTLALYGLGLEWTTSERLCLLAEVYSESDLELEADDNLMEARVGAAWVAADWLVLSAGFGFGLTEVAHDHHFTLATLVGW